MEIPQITTSPTKQQLLDALTHSKWFGLNDMPFKMSKVSFEKRVTNLVGYLGEKNRVVNNGVVSVYFYIPARNLADIQLNAKYPENKLNPIKQKITPYKLKPEDKLFNLMMGV